MSQNGVKLAVLAMERGRAGIVLQNDARVIERPGRKVRADPAGKFFQRFGDGENGPLLREFLDHRGERVPEAEADQPDFRLPRGAKGCASEPREFFFRRTGRRAADLLTTDDQIMAAIVLLEDERRAVRQLRFFEIDSWFHGACDLLCAMGLSKWF